MKLWIVCVIVASIQSLTYSQTIRTVSGGGADFGNLKASIDAINANTGSTYTGNNVVGGSLTIPLSIRMGTVNDWFKSSEYPILEFAFENIEYPSSQESQIRFNPLATTHYANEYDCDYLPGFAPLFYSGNSGSKLSVNSSPESYDGLILPMEFSPNKGANFKIVAKENSIQERVWLHDKKENHFTPLFSSSQIVFTSSLTDPIDRFEVFFGKVGIQELDTKTYSLSQNNGLIIINSLLSSSIGSIAIDDMTRRFVFLQIQRAKL